MEFFPNAEGKTKTFSQHLIFSRILSLASKGHLLIYFICFSWSIMQDYKKLNEILYTGLLFNSCVYGCLLLACNFMPRKVLDGGILSSRVITYPGRNTVLIQVLLY